MAEESNKIEDYPHVDLLYPSKYLKGADLRGRDVVVTIKAIEPRHGLHRKGDREGEASEHKPVVHFVESSKFWVLNKTNAMVIADLYGKELKQWIGKKVTLHTESVFAFGRNHDAVRVKPEKPKE